MVGNSVRDVYIETGLIPQRAEDWILEVLDVAAELVFMLGEEFGVAGRWEMENLGKHTGDAMVSALDSQGSGLGNNQLLETRSNTQCDRVLQGWLLR